MKEYSKLNSKSKNQISKLQFKIKNPWNNQGFLLYKSIFASLTFLPLWRSSGFLESGFLSFNYS